jgi:hypothetical protein
MAASDGEEKDVGWRYYLPHRLSCSPRDSVSRV